MKLRYVTAMAALLVSLALASPASASEVRLVADSSVPGAVGKAHLGKDKNGNLRLKLDVYHLARPSSLTPAKQTYVVWFEPKGKSAENEGQLQVNKKLEGKFETTTSYQDFDVFVTAEDNPRVETPSEPKVLKGTMQP